MDPTHTDLSTCGCPVSHDELKSTPSLWATLHYVGVQVIPAYESEPEERFELRNTPSPCHSTLAVQL